MSAPLHRSEPGRDLSERVKREAVEHVEKYGDRHSWTSCPPGSRALCSHRTAYEAAKDGAA